MSEVRICPLCEMAAHRLPDVGEKMAFQCENRHPVFLEDAPAKVAIKAVSDAVPVRDELKVEPEQEPPKTRAPKRG